MSQEIARILDFPYESKYIEVCGSKLHYIDEGEGEPIVFLHGIPTWSYLWRNITPYFKDQYRCIAVDLIGCGMSDKPDIKYSIENHCKYFDEFMQKMNLDNVTLVLHAWGSIIGFNYAMQNQEKIKSLAFYESHVRPTTEWEMVALPIQQLFSVIVDEAEGKNKILNTDYFIEEIFPLGFLTRISEDEMQYYRQALSTPITRKVIWDYLREVPTGRNEDGVIQCIADYSQQLEQSNIPKLMLYAVPGFITTIDTVQWAKQNLANLNLVDLGDAMHYAQETSPAEFANAILEWRQKL